MAGGAPSQPADRLPRAVWTAVGTSRRVCFTVLNQGDLLQTRLAKGGADLIGAVVLSDETRTVCADADEARVDCADDTPKCRFWWRVDKWF